MPRRQRQVVTKFSQTVVEWFYNECKPIPIKPPEEEDILWMLADTLEEISDDERVISYTWIWLAMKTETYRSSVTVPADRDPRPEPIYPPQGKDWALTRTQIIPVKGTPNVTYIWTWRRVVGPATSPKD